MELLHFLCARSLAVVEGVGIGGIEVDQTRNSVRVPACDRSQFRSAEGVPCQDRSAEFERVDDRQHVVTEAVSRVFRG